VRTIEDHKPWLVIVTVIKEISQSSVQGAFSVIVVGNVLVAQNS